MSAVSLSRHSFERCWGRPLLHSVCRVAILKPVTSKEKASTIQQLNGGALIMANVGRKKWLWGFSIQRLKALLLARTSCCLSQCLFWGLNIVNCHYGSHSLSLFVFLSLSLSSPSLTFIYFSPIFFI